MNSNSAKEETNVSFQRLIVSIQTERHHTEINPAVLNNSKFIVGVVLFLLQVFAEKRKTDLQVGPPSFTFSPSRAACNVLHTLHQNQNVCSVAG
ncbi:unnamed protein product [Amoebophrya sp. A120]|nr:unnamed protein product [Amoebophrya sp. A120]|eukprot:GSA120T00005669001.1